MTYHHYNKLELFLFKYAFYNLGSANIKIASGHFKGKVSLMTQRSNDRRHDNEFFLADLFQKRIKRSQMILKSCSYSDKADKSVQNGAIRIQNDILGIPFAAYDNNG